MLVSIAWLPVVIGALVTGQAFGSGVEDPLFRHFAVHARLLISVPLLIFAEAVVEKRIPTLVRHFVTSGLVAGGAATQYQAVLASAVRLRDSAWGTLFVLAVMGSTILSSTTRSRDNDEVSWAVALDSVGGIGFPGWWYIFISRPIFAGLLAIWCWRMLTVWVLVAKTSKLELQLVPSHPDRAGGLGFMEGAPAVFAPVVLAMSVVLAGMWGHSVLYHGVHVDQIRIQALVFIALMVIIFNGPLLLWSRTLVSFRRRKLLEYSTLVSRHGRLVHRKWIDSAELGTVEILEAPELGPTADINAIYEAVANMRTAPISKHSVVPIALAAALPLVPVFAIEIPIKELLKSLLGALV